MTYHVEIEFKKINDKGRLTTRGFFHLFSSDAHQGLLFVEIWGYKLGNGFVRYMDLYADNWQGYVNSRLNSKSLMQVDGKSSAVEVSITELTADSDVADLVRFLLSDKAGDHEVVSALGKWSKSAVASTPTPMLKAAYHMVSSRDSGGVTFSEGKKLKGIKATTITWDEISTTTSLAEPEKPKPASITYDNWGTY